MSKENKAPQDPEESQEKMVILDIRETQDSLATGDLMADRVRKESEDPQDMVEAHLVCLAHLALLALMEREDTLVYKENLDNLADLLKALGAKGVSLER